MAYKVIILYRLYMPSYFLGTFTEYPYLYKIKHLFYKNQIHLNRNMSKQYTIQPRSYHLSLPLPSK